MTDRGTIIKWFEFCRVEDKCSTDCPYWNNRYSARECTKELAKDILTILKEQEEPKHIIRKQCKKEWEDGYIEYFAEWYCPHCNSLMAQGFDNPSIKFCYRCGKPITWEGW